MNTPTAVSKVYELWSPKLNASFLTAPATGTTNDHAPQEMITQWSVNRLFWVKDALPRSMRTRRGPWAAGSTEPGYRGFRCWSADVAIGVRSPLSAEVFHAMPLAERVDHLRTWKSETQNWDGPVREGLAGILQNEVQAQPVFYFEHAGQFTGLDPLYSTALVRGLSEGLKGQAGSSWEPFWEFVRWVLAQPDPETEIRDGFSGETRPGRCWQACRLEIARFLDATLNGELAPLPLVERASVWQFVELLSRDPNPTPADEAAEDESIMDPFTLSLNSVRGVAVHAVFSFIHWIRSHSSAADQGGRELDDVPEARAALEACLDPRIESSRTIWSVFGANLTRLAYWAEAWLADHLDQIFPAQGHNEQWKIAWETFVRFSRQDSRELAVLRRLWNWQIQRETTPGGPGFQDEVA